MSKVELAIFLYCESRIGNFSILRKSN
jgi:hypothetical protein